MSRGCDSSAGIYVPNEIPVGGITYLFDEIKRYKTKDCDLVFCIDSPPRIKREMHSKAFPDFGGYKGNRGVADFDITIQKQMVAEILQQLGFVVISLEGFEADDLIASLVKYYKDSYERIYIHSKDSDLYHLVCSNVECIWPGKTNKHITLHNWSTSVHPSHTIEYNMLTLFKMWKGEPGDNIPNVPWFTMKKVYDKIPPTFYNKFGDNEFLRQVVAKYTNEDQRAMDVMNLIIPLIAKFNEVELYEEYINTDLYRYYKEEFKMEKCSSTNVDRNPEGNATLQKYIDLYSRR